MKEERTCEQIYQEYLEIKARVDRVAEINSPTTRGTYTVQSPDGEDVLRLKKLARELVWNCEEFLREKTGVYYGVEHDADEMCTCTHSRNSHNGIRQYEDGEPAPRHEMDGGCRVDDCECEHYELGN